MKTIQAGRYSVTIKELTYWATEEIKSCLVEGVRMKGNDLTGLNGQATLEAKKKTLELSITEIKEGDTVIPFSLVWLKQLTQEEGDAIDNEIDELSKKK